MFMFVFVCRFYLFIYLLTCLRYICQGLWQKDALDNEIMADCVSEMVLIENGYHQSDSHETADYRKEMVVEVCC